MVLSVRGRIGGMKSNRQVHFGSRPPHLYVGVLKRREGSGPVYVERYERDFGEGIVWDLGHSVSAWVPNRSPSLVFPFDLGRLAMQQEPLHVAAHRLQELRPAEDQKSL